MKQGYVWIAAAVLLFTGTLGAERQAASTAARPPAPVSPAQTATTPSNGRTYVGSAACRNCHAPIYERWTKTRMANVVTRSEGASRGDHPRLHQARSARDVHEGRHRVRLRQQVEAALLHEGRRRLLSAAARSGTSRTSSWRPYFVAPNTDWWVPHYPADNMKRPTGPLCDGCHSVNYNIQTKTGHRVERRLREVPRPRQRARRAARRATNIVNPARLDSVHANDTCIQCHSQGQPLTNPIDGQYYDWPVGFQSGRQPAGLLEARRAQARRDDVHALRRRHRAQEPDAGQRLRAERDVHARRHLLQLPRRARHRQQRRPDQAGATSCACTCHGPKSPNGPHAADASKQHTHHTARAAPATSASRCHMPKIEQTDRRRQRAQPHLRVHHAGDDRPVQDAERVHAAATPTRTPRGRSTRSRRGPTSRPGASAPDAAASPPARKANGDPGDGDGSRGNRGMTLGLPHRSDSRRGALTAEPPAKATVVGGRMTVGCRHRRPAIRNCCSRQHCGSRDSVANGAPRRRRRLRDRTTTLGLPHRSDSRRGKTAARRKSADAGGGWSAPNDGGPSGQSRADPRAGGESGPPLVRRARGRFTP